MRLVDHDDELPVVDAKDLESALEDIHELQLAAIKNLHRSRESRSIAADRSPLQAITATNRYGIQPSTLETFHCLFQHLLIARKG